MDLLAPAPSNLGAGFVQPAPAAASVREQIGDCALISAVWMTLALFLKPFQNTPFVDDWLYGWSVQNLLHGGGLRALDYCSNANPVHVLWGTLFCLPMGFSFAALQFSTWIAALFCLNGLYVLLRELQVSRRDAFIGTETLMVYPVFLVLSHSFMTDVPFLACMIWFVLALVRAVRRRSDTWLWAAVLFAMLASGIRAVSAVLPVVMFIVLLVHAGDWGRRRGRWMIAFLPLVTLGISQWWLAHFMVHVAHLNGEYNAPANRWLLLKEVAIPYLPRMTIAGITFAAGVLGIALLPLSAGAIVLGVNRVIDLPGFDNREGAKARRKTRSGMRGWRIEDGRWRITAQRHLPSSIFHPLLFFASALAPSCLRGFIARHRAASVMLIVVGLLSAVAYLHAVHQDFFPAMAAGETWSPQELGATQPLVANAPVIQQGKFFNGFIIVLSFVSAAMVICEIACGSWVKASVPIVWTVLGSFGLIVLLWLFYDRYGLVLVPLVIALMLSTGPVRRRSLAIAIIVIFAIVGIMQDIDHLSYNRALWSAVDDFRRANVPVDQIDGGYTVNGWQQYAHPQFAPRDSRGEVRVPKINAFSGTLRYLISNTSQTGYTVIGEHRYRRWLGTSGTIYELRRDQMPLQVGQFDAVSPSLSQRPSGNE